MEEDIEILNIYNKIKLDRLKYCNICLKNEKETKLVVSKGLIALLKGLQNDKIQIAEHTLICYMCDARATTAAAFVSSLDFASDVKFIFDAMDSNSALQEQFRNCYNGSKRVRGRSLIKNFLRCEKDLPSVQRRSEFSQSQVLLVGSSKSCIRGSKEVIEKKKTNCGSPKTEIVISDDEDDDDAVICIPMITPTPIEKLLNKPPSKSKSSQKESPPKKLVPQKTQHQNKKKQQNETQQQNELQQQNLPNIQIIRSENNNFMINPQLPNNFPSLVFPKNSNAAVIHPIYQDPSGTILIPTLGGAIDKLGNFKPLQQVTLDTHTQQVQSVINNGSPPIITTNPLISNNTALNNIIPVISDVRPPINNVRPPINNVRHPKNNVKHPKNNVRPQKNNVRPPVNTDTDSIMTGNGFYLNLTEFNTPRIESVVSESQVNDKVGVKTKPRNSSAVDWEDRIPMDLISVMENPSSATVINKRQNNNGICSIKDVRSVR